MTLDNDQKYYAGPVTDHFDGERFFNPWNRRSKKGFLDILKWRFEGNKADWPDHANNPPRPAVQPVRKDLTVTYIGHATFLVQVDGRNTLIDPFFSDRASPFGFMGPKRILPPFLPLKALPPIHAVFVSHNHYDHLDLMSLNKLAENPDTTFITPLGNSRILNSIPKISTKIISLDWHESVKIGDGINLTLVPSQHWSRRGLDDTNRDLWGGCIIEANGSTVYYSSDTGFDASLFTGLKNRYGAPDIALLPIGAYAPRWFMKYSHMNPQEAIQTFKLLGAKKAMGFHHETLQLSDEPFDDARKYIEKTFGPNETQDASFCVPYPGDSVTSDGLSSTHGAGL